MRGKDSNLRPPGYEPGELPLLHPAIMICLKNKSNDFIIISQIDPLVKHICLGFKQNLVARPLLSPSFYDQTHKSRHGRHYKAYTYNNPLLFYIPLWVRLSLSLGASLPRTK